MVEIFAGTGRVTAALRAFGLSSSFGTDHVKSKHAAGPIVLADLTTESGIELLMQWLYNPYVIGILMALPCRSASKGAKHSVETEIACGPTGTKAVTVR